MNCAALSRLKKYENSVNSDNNRAQSSGPRSVIVSIATLVLSSALVPALSESPRQEKRFSCATETDAKTGWKIAVLRYHNPEGEPVEARIAPDAGSNLYSLKLGATELLVQPADMAALPGVRYGFPILYPTPNRVRDGQFSFDGVDYSFPPNNRGNFIHGLVHSVKWEIGPLSCDSHQARVQTWLNWDSTLPAFKLFPIQHRLRMTYTLKREGIKMEFAVENRDRRRLPFGFALHPWFRVLGERAGTYLHVPAARHMESVELLPTGKLESLEGSAFDLRSPVSLERLRLDDVYWGMRPEHPAGYEARDQGIKLTLAASQEFTHMVVYTPEGKPFFCMENQTCSTDAHNLFARGFEKEAHLLIAEKGKPVRGWVLVKIVSSPLSQRTKPKIARAVGSSSLMMLNISEMWLSSGINTSREATRSLRRAASSRRACSGSSM